MTTVLKIRKKKPRIIIDGEKTYLRINNQIFLTDITLINI